MLTIFDYKGRDMLENLKVGLVSLGCAKNLVDSERALGFLTQRGYQVTPNAEDADIILVNTCGFIEAAKEESIATILEMAEYKARGCSTLVVTGCLSQRYREELKDELPEVDILIGVDEYESLPDLLDERYGRSMRVGPLHEQRLLSTPSHFAYLRVAEGCNHRCSFCAIPMIRGAYRSVPYETLLQEARDLADAGVQELVLIAQDTTRYGIDLYGKRRLAELMNDISAMPFRWIRLLYAYPNDITNELIDVMMQHDNICKYIDIPLQHIDDELLYAMRRKSNKEEIESLLARIRKADPNFVLRTTFISGFPGETDEAFDSLCTFVKEAEFDRAGVFCYSAEEGTPAATYENQVPKEIAEQRAARLMEIQQEESRKRLKRRVGECCEMVVEAYDEARGCYVGRSYGEAPEIDGSLYLSAEQPTLPLGIFVKVEIVDSDDYDLYCELR